MSINRVLIQKEELRQVQIRIKNLPREMSLLQIEEKVKQFFMGDEKIQIEIYTLTKNTLNLIDANTKVILSKQLLGKVKNKFMKSQSNGTGVIFQLLSNSIHTRKNLLNQKSDEKMLQEISYNQLDALESEEKTDQKNLILIYVVLFTALLIIVFEIFDIPSTNYVNKQGMSYQFQVDSSIYEAHSKIRDSVKLNEKKDQNYSNYVYIRDTQIEIINFPVCNQLDMPIEQLKFTFFKDLSPETKKNVIQTESEGKTKEQKYINMFLSFKKLVKAQKQIELQYIFYNQTYNLDQKRKMNSFCIIFNGRNYFTRKYHDEFLISLSNQNYTNFKVFLIDNNSDDYSTEKTYAYLNKNFPHLKTKVTFIKNIKHVGDFMSRDSGIKENCHEDDIVIDMSQQAVFVGRQSLNVINAIFQENDNVWILKTNYFKLSPQKQKIFSVKNEKNSQNVLRYSETTERPIQAFRMKLYGKIPLNYLTVAMIENEEGIFDYYKNSADKILYFSLGELAGSSRVYYAPQFLFQYQNIFSLKGCARKKEINDEMISRSMRPLAQLGSIAEDPITVEEWSGKQFDLTFYESAATSCVDQ